MQSWRWGSYQAYDPVTKEGLALSASKIIFKFVIKFRFKYKMIYWQEVCSEIWPNNVVAV